MFILQPLAKSARPRRQKAEIHEFSIRHFYPSLDHRSYFLVVILDLYPYVLVQRQPGCSHLGDQLTKVIRVLTRLFDRRTFRCGNRSIGQSSPITRLTKFE